MKIAILTPWSISPDAVGGTERFVMDLAESFTNLNNEVDVYMLSGKSYEKDNIKYINMNLFDSEEIIDEYFLREKFNKFSSKESYKNLSKNIENKVDFSKYDLIQINSQLFLNVCQNKKRIFTIHTNPFEYKLDWGEESFTCMLEIMKEEYMNNNTRFVTPSKYYANEYKELTGINIDFIPHAIDIKRILNNRNKKDILNSMNINNNKKIILLPSRLEPIQKQPMLFMKAFAKLDESIKKQYLVICTGADKQYMQYKEDIENFCKENKIDLIITRFKYMSDAYKIADIVALPSQSESFGYSALESLSLGIMTIMNNIPTFKEVADGSENNYFFNNDIDSLYKVLNENINKTKRIKQPDNWKNKYSIVEFGKRYLSLYY